LQEENMKAIAVIAALLGAASAQKTFPLTFTGNAETDFPAQVGAQTNFGAKRYPIIVELDNINANQPVTEDVGVPAQWPFPRSGWDMKDLRFAYDYALDQFHVAINCFGVCGDADGDNLPGGTSIGALMRRAVRISPFSTARSRALIAIDIGNPDTPLTSGTPDGQFDIIFGYPAQLATGSDRFPCGDNKFDTSCFGLYRVATVNGAEQLGQRFLYKNGDVALTTAAFNFAKDRNPDDQPAAPRYRVVDRELQPGAHARRRGEGRQHWCAPVPRERCRLLRLVPGQRCR
jgi:hypothetical protein